MRDLTRDPDFIQELREARLVTFASDWQKLERDGLSEFEVVGAVHLAHAAAAGE
jgi:hypothetical protein